ncbi:hypothetical protein [Comamonas thiooxydans]|uniref:hypothetical protein n=1 Tax=Comamonas thiooxydans TaxID=363952 RepID=UPI000B416D59|nr:hypothetical protein [Comamonas thiooxydans]
MKKSELTKLEKRAVSGGIVDASMLKNKSPRTLIYGFETNRETRHIYLSEAGELVDVTYNHNKVLLREVRGSLDLHECVPSKRAYPSACDYEFCALMLKRGVKVVFTTFDPRPEIQYHGALSESLVTAIQPEELEVKVEDPGPTLDWPSYFDDVAVLCFTSKVEDFLKVLLSASVFGHAVAQDSALIERRLVELIDDLTALALDLNSRIPVPREKIETFVRAEFAKTMERAEELKKRFNK